MGLRWIITALFFFTATKVSASEIPTGSAALFYFTQSRTFKNNDDDTKTNRKYQFIDLGFCYTMDVICFGAKYTELSVEAESEFNGFSDDEGGSKYTGLGIKIGVSLKNGFIAHFAYMVENSLEEGQGRDKVSYNITSANILDLGYGFKVQKLRAGPMISSVTYKIDRAILDSGEEVDLNLTQQYTIPFLALWIDF